MENPRGAARNEPTAETELSLGIEEVGGLVSNDQIAHLNENVGPANTVALNSCDHGLVERNPDPRNTLEQLGIARRVPDVRANGEGALNFFTQLPPLRARLLTAIRKTQPFLR